MDYLLRDAYFTGVTYGSFDLTRILEVIRPYRDGICFTDKGIHSVEDYIISRYQMYQQVYFHRVNRSMEVILHHLLERAQIIYEEGKLQVTPQLEAFLNGKWTLEDYLKLDDGVMETNFLLWTNSGIKFYLIFQIVTYTVIPLKVSKLMKILRVYCQN